MAYKDDRGRYHEDWSDWLKANRRYSEEKEQGAAIASAAKSTAIQSARAAEAIEVQNTLLAEQNKLLMMTPEERAAYKERLEEAKRQEQRRKAEEEAFWSSPVGVEARKRLKEQAKRAEEQANQDGVEARKLVKEQAKRAEEQANQESLAQQRKFLRLWLWCGIPMFAVFLFVTLSNPKIDLFGGLFASVITSAITGGIFAYFIFHRNK